MLNLTEIWKSTLQGGGEGGGLKKPLSRRRRIKRKKCFPFKKRRRIKKKKMFSAFLGDGYLLKPPKSFIKTCG